MKAILVPVILIIGTVTGCLNSHKTICIRDSQGNPINQCMLLAIESQIFLPNKRGIFYSDQKGRVQIPYRGYVLYYAGKNHYKISSTASAKENVDITIYNDSQILPSNIFISKSIGVLHEYLSGIPLYPMEIEYFTSTQVVIPNAN